MALRYAEIINQPYLNTDKKLNLYIGFEPGKIPDIGYLSLLHILAELIRTEKFNTTILIADLHIILGKGLKMAKNNMNRVAYYQFIISTILNYFRISRHEYKFRLGSGFQLSTEYVYDLMSLMTTVRMSDAKKAVKGEEKDPVLSTVIYPLLQIMDEIALDADVELGGIDQKNIFLASLEFKHRLKTGVEKHDRKIKDLAYIMPASLDTLEISFLDTNPEIKNKIYKSFSRDRDMKNSCLLILRDIIYPILGHSGRRFGTTCSGYTTFDTFNIAWACGSILNKQLKAVVLSGLIEIISPIRDIIYENINLYHLAYPEE